MRIVFDPDFEWGCWPGPVPGLGASAGEDWVGPTRFVQLLETALGLVAPRATSGDRCARLVSAFRQAEGFWSDSAAVDPFATARRLFRWRDTLAMAGWRGEGRQPRLAALARLMTGCAPGLPDRLQAVVAALGRRSPDIEAVDLFLPRGDFEPLWRQVLARLEQRGARVAHTPLPAAMSAPGTDLGRVRSGRFRPTGDRSLRLLRPAGPLEAAEEVAAWIASLPSPTHRVIVGADPALDAALHRHGLPTTGAREEQHDAATLQVLPLVLEMGWKPQDPQRAYELLSLQSGPVPGQVARRLRRALGEWPAVDSDSWRTALAEGLEAIEDTERRDRARRRLDVLWDARVPRTADYPVEEVARRTALLRGWFGGRVASAEKDDTTDAAAWRAGASQCDALLRLLQHAGLRELSAAQLRRLLAEASNDAEPEGRFEPQAGLHVVGRPGGVAGPAPVITWWRFDEASVTPIFRLPLTRAERDDLGALGIVLPEPADLAAAQARRWRRPLDCAGERLLLVCAEKDDEGNELHPHPLWDELVSRVADEKNPRRVADATLSCTSLDDSLPRRRREKLPLPGARQDWSLPAARIARRVTESPSSVAKLLECPFQWIVEYAGGLRAPDSAQVEDGTGPRLLGNLLHSIMNSLFAGPSRRPDEAAHQAGVIFDRDGPRLAAALFLPGADGQRERVRRAAIETARTLYALMQSAGVKVVATEQERVGRAFGTTFGGRVDLVLGPPTRILDLKWSGAPRKRQALKDGCALQLAAYAFLERGEDGRFPPVAYFVMDRQLLLTTDPKAFPKAEPVEGPSAEETWRAADATHRAVWQAVAEGRIAAPGAGRDKDEKKRRQDAGVIDGRLVLPSDCRYCDYTALCGLAFVEEP